MPVAPTDVSADHVPPPSMLLRYDTRAYEVPLITSPTPFTNIIKLASERTVSDLDVEATGVMVPRSTSLLPQVSVAILKSLYLLEHAILSTSPSCNTAIEVGSPNTVVGLFALSASEKDDVGSVAL